jgi:hypothetical protein
LVLRTYKGLPKELTRLRVIPAKGLEATKPLWPEVRAAFGWVHRAAVIMRNKKGLDATGVRRRYRGLVAATARHRRASGGLAEALAHFLKVTRSYWPGLSACYGVADLPRTNNDLEQFFGSYRYHERRASGREVACPGTVVRGSVRLAASAETRLRSVTAADLVPGDLKAWRELRGSLERRQAVRTLSRRFRRDPVAYLRSLEESLIRQALPS